MALVPGIARDIERTLRATLIHRPWWAGPRIVVTTTPIVGIATGSFSVDDPSRAVLMLYAAIKMPILVLATTALCLPAFFTLHLCLGLRREFPVALRAVLGGQAMFAIVLASLSPLIPVWYTAVERKSAAVLGAAALFALAALCSLTAVRRVYTRELPRRPAHRFLALAWFALYALVGIQLGWMLRPFIGSPDLGPALLREEAFTNGYVVVLRMLIGG